MDFPADAAAMRCVGHQHAIATGKAEIRGQSRAFVAAFFLDDLYQQYLTAVDNVLDFVTATQVHTLGTNFIARFGLAFPTATTAPATTAVVTAIVAGRFLGRTIFTFFAISSVEFRLFAFRDVDGVDAVVAFDFDDVGVIVVGIVGSADQVGWLFVLFLFLLTQRGFFSSGLGLFGEQTFAIFTRDLIIIGVNFGKSQKAMAIAAIIDERRLQRRFDAGYFG